MTDTKRPSPPKRYRVKSECQFNGALGIIRAGAFVRDDELKMNIERQMHVLEEIKPAVPSAALATADTITEDE